jgi:uncharacterized protein YycO
METIVVGFSKAKKKTAIVSWLIRLFQNTPFSHTYIRFYSQKYDRWLVYQASKTAVNFMEYSHFLENNEIVEEITIITTDAQKTALVTYAIDTVGRPYSIKALLGFALETIGLPYKWLLQNGDKSYVCSELVLRALNEAYIEEAFEDPDLVTPKELYEFIKNKY